MKDNLNYFKELIKTAYNDFKNGTKTMFKEFFKQETNKKQRANMWTFARLIIPIITLIMSISAIIISSPLLFIATGLVAGFGAVTDYLDGKSSRKHNSASEYGKLLDQVSDKFFAGIMGINLTFLNPAYIFVLIGELLIASVNVFYKLKYKNLDIKSTTIGKIKEWPLFMSLAIGFLSPISTIFLAISNISIVLTTILQLTTTISYLKENNNSIKMQKSEQTINMIEDIQNENKKLNLYETKDNKKLEQYKELRDVLNKIIEQNQVVKGENNIDSIQKTKKL